VYQDQGIREHRPEHGEADQVERPVGRGGQDQVRQRRKADDETDAQQQVASYLGASLDQVQAPEIAFQRRIVEAKAWKAALELQCVNRLRRRFAAVD
jgi:hypothetical protein